MKTKKLYLAAMLFLICGFSGCTNKSTDINENNALNETKIYTEFETEFGEGEQ